MNDKEYRRFVDDVKRLIFKSGKAFYIIAPDIGISDKTLKRFLEYRSVTIYNVILIADYFKINIFGKNSEKVD